MNLVQKPSGRSATRHLATAMLAVYWTALCVGTHLPGRFLTAPLNVSDKVLHFLAYTGLGILLAAFLPLLGARDWRVSWGALAIVLVYAALDELGQMLVPGRTAELADWLANAGGAVTGVSGFQLTYLSMGAPFLRLQLEKKPSPP